MDFDATQNPSYFGRGKVQFTAPLKVDGTVNPLGYGARWGNNWADLSPTAGDLRMPPGRFVGNAKALEVLPQLERANVSAWNTGSSLIVKSVEASLTLYGHGAQNLADALHAVRSQAVATPRIDYFATGRASVEAGSMVFTRHLVETDLPMSVTPSWATWTEGVEWAREAFGVRLLCGFSGPAGSTLAIGYTSEGGADTLEALTATDIELGLVYTGTNSADGSAVRLDCYRATPLLNDALRPISDAAGVVTLKFLLKPVLALPDMRARWYRVLRGHQAMH